jgi:uncharacterized protein YerC
MPYGSEGVANRKSGNMEKFNFKTLSYNMARRNLGRGAKVVRTKWDLQGGERLLEAFSLAAKGGFMKEFLDDLLSEKEFKRFVARLQTLEQIFMGTPYSYMTETNGLSSKTISAISKKTADKKGGYYRVMRERYPRGFKYFD